MESLVEAFGELDLGAVADDEVIALLEEAGMKISKSFIKKAVHERHSFQCLKCRRHWKSRKRLVAHLLRNRQHIKSKERIKAGPRKFAEHIAQKYGGRRSRDKSLASFNSARFHEYTEAEQRRFVSVYLEIAHMVDLRY